MTEANGIDAQGPWFDGVAFLAGRNVSGIYAAAAKGRRVAIVGAGGMAGLMAHLVLPQAGFQNLPLVEASGRLSGRVHTTYLSGGLWDYSYREMGPMRFPHEFTYENKTYNISDYQLVFQLAAELNRLNEGRPGNLSADFIPWIQSSENGLVYKNGFKLASGMPPTVGQIRENSTLGPAPLQYDVQTAAAAAAAAMSSGTTPSPRFLLEAGRSSASGTRRPGASPGAARSRCNGGPAMRGRARRTTTRSWRCPLPWSRAGGCRRWASPSAAPSASCPRRPPARWRLSTEPILGGARQVHQGQLLDQYRHPRDRDRLLPLV